MELLPPEIVDHIVSSLPIQHQQYFYDRSRRGNPCRDQQLAQYSPISRAWKASVERITFRHFVLQSDDFDTFASLFRDEGISRLASLRTLKVDFILPIPPNAHGCCTVEQPPDRESDTTVFSASVAKLFAILAGLETRATEQQPLYLNLCFNAAYRLSQSKGLQTPYLEKCVKGEFSDFKHTQRELREANAISGQFELMHDNIIPMVHGITTFTYLGLHHLRDLKSTCIPRIVARMPNLNKMRIRTEDNYDTGQRLAASIGSLAGTHLRAIQLDIQRLEMKNENMPVHRFVENGKWGQESWFRMLSHFASLPNLTILQLKGGLVVCPEFFRGVIGHPGIPFPSLVELEVQFSPETADGRWFYERDDEAIERSRSDPKYEEFWEEDDDDSDYARSLDSFGNHSDDYVRVFEDGPLRTKIVSHDRFRSVPNTATLLPFLMDASKIALRVPNLQKFILKLGSNSAKYNELDYYPIVSRVFELWYVKAGTYRTPHEPVFFSDYIIPADAAYLNQNRLYWRVNGTKLWEEVQAAWCAIIGPEAKIVFLEEDHFKYISHKYWVYEGQF
ncbi:hypothetical protein GQ44DRAFT_830254 [Phaeosphaeriaceae sp. PMI808]|nr:hypothetical protein GQ44DRAFT_830254 [Phaeosphaeriaceae sp. PMI808]